MASGIFLDVGGASVPGDVQILSLESHISVIKIVPLWSSFKLFSNYILTTVIYLVFGGFIPCLLM